jgi:hypothetical protein
MRCYSFSVHLFSIKHGLHTLYGVTVLLLLTSSITAHASLWDILEGDLDAADSSQQTDAAQDALLRVEAEREGRKDLFPAFPAQVKGVLAQRIEERAGDFVSAMVNGVNIVFHDVPLGEWFAPYVRTMAEKGVVNGYKDSEGNPLGEFRPAHSVSIQELAKIAVLMTGGTTGCPTVTHNLTASGSWSAQFIACAEGRQWVVYSDGAVDVTRPATRGEVVMTVLQAYKKEAGSPLGTVFTDVPISIQFAAAIEKAHTDGIVNGYTDAQGNSLGLFGPTYPVKRAELVKILTLADQAYGQTAKH